MAQLAYHNLCKGYHRTKKAWNKCEKKNARWRWDSAGRKVKGKGGR